ncbi:hypothetical protein LTR33_006791 [Friedmanniomyces endolithicus]|nr:hypothetical protein LTR33_006791 [Friedmanniomyces endolithicus]
MAPARPALAQSESKARFFERLGLDDNNELHRRIYAMMKEEAVEAFKRLTENREALVVELRHTGLEPPFSHAQISETAIHREILHMYYHARPETRVVYDLAHDRERLEEENWVVRWLLWHVFRYRDNRNRNRRGPSNGSPGDDDDDDDDTESGDGSTSAGGSSNKGKSLQQIQGAVTIIQAVIDISVKLPLALPRPHDTGIPCGTGDAAQHGRHTSYCISSNTSSPGTLNTRLTVPCSTNIGLSALSDNPREDQDSSDNHLPSVMQQTGASRLTAGTATAWSLLSARKAP